MADPTGGYREKYRLAISEQERLEKQFAFQLDALRATLLQLSSAASGQDAQLDASLTALKEKMHGASGQQVYEQLKRVQQAATDFDHARVVYHSENAQRLAAVADQLAELRLPDTLHASVLSYSKGLNKRLSTMRAYPEILDQLLNLQKLALAAASDPSANFWQRLRSGNTLQAAKAHNANAEPPPAESAARPAAEGSPSSPDDSLDLQLASTEPNPPAAPFGQRTIKFDAGEEDSYQAVAQRIADTLQSLVDRIEPNDMVRHKMDIVRHRIQRGMDWYALAITLEDIRDILLLRYLQSDQEFSAYLKRVNDELQAIGSALGLAQQQESQLREASDSLSNAVSSHVDQMRNSVQSSTSLEQLKQAVSQHLSTIQAALVRYQERPPSESTLSEQLKTLVERVHAIESESKKTKEQLEEERHRATHDVLTGLPNRELYNERAYQELQRFRRYCRPLIMAVCDIDNFKEVNDSYGHQAGDKVIKLIAKVLASRLRKVDFVARYGGEEFVILMPETPTNDALAVLDKIRATIAKTPFRFKDSPIAITISFGLAGFDADDTVDQVFERADRALYQAKREGRNRCVIAGAG